jgi:hypothetical protein
MWRVARAFHMSWDAVMDIYKRALPNAPLDYDPRLFIKTTLKKPLFLPEAPEEMEVDDEAEVDELEEEEDDSTEGTTGRVAGPPRNLRKRRVLRHVGSYEEEKAKGKATEVTGSPRKRAKALPTIRIPPVASRQQVAEGGRAQVQEVAAVEPAQRQVAWEAGFVDRALEKERQARLEAELVKEELRRTKALLAAERETLGEEREARAAILAQVEDHGREVGRIRAEHGRLEVMLREETRRRVEAEKERDLARKSTEEVLQRIGQAPGSSSVDGKWKGTLALIGAEMASLEVARGQWESGVEGSSELVRASSHKIIKLVKEELDRL